MRPNDTIENPNPSGLCLCGCGGATRIARKTCRALGYVRGCPVRYMVGHRDPGEVPPEPNPSGLCQCGCGKPTRIAKQTIRTAGVVRGRPNRFLPGHAARKYPVFPFVVDPETGCWEWTGSTSRGYGQLHIANRKTPAHIWFYRQAKGEIPTGLELDHTCRNTRCVNPDHLEPVTSAVNSQRSRAAKLTPEDVRTIRQQAKTVSQREMARRFGVHHSTIRALVLGRSWRNVDHDNPLAA